MSIIETLHRARQARLQRIAARAVVQPAAGAAPQQAARPMAGSRGRTDGDYERAWAFEMLGLVARADRFAKLRLEDVQRATARHFGLARGDILSLQPSRAAARLRQVAMYLARQLTAKSYPELGRAFGGRDHSTVLHAVRRIEDQLTRDGDLADAVTSIRAALAEGPE
jgi:Bacterial dnaA protein helix-turn-helix